MTKETNFYTLIVLLGVLCLFPGVFGQALNSPCPRVFLYDQRNNASRWYGTAYLYSQSTLREIWITVTLDNPPLGLYSEFGEVIVTHNREFVIRFRNIIQQADTPFNIRFYVDYNPNGPIPRLIYLQLNSQLVCSDEYVNTPNLNTNLYSKSGGGTPLYNNIPANQPISQVSNAPTSLYSKSGGGAPLYYSVTPNQPIGQQVSQIPNVATNLYSKSGGGAPLYNNIPPNQPISQVSNAPTNLYSKSGGGAPLYYSVTPNQPIGQQVSQISNVATNLYSKSGGGAPLFNNIPPNQLPNIPQPDSNLYAKSGGGTPRITIIPLSNYPISQKISQQNVPSVTALSAKAGPPQPITQQISQVPILPSNRPVGFIQRPQGIQRESNENGFNDNLLNVNANIGCGTVAGSATPLVANGQVANTGQFPWHVALYHSSRRNLTYECGGSLVSKHHVVTAGHCVISKGENLPPEDIVLYLGKYYSNQWGSPGIQHSDVSKYILHPEYNNNKMYQNDVAVLKMSNAVEFTEYVRPICLWNENLDINNEVGKIGTVVGWGLTEKGIFSEELMKLDVPIVTKETCIYSNPDVYAKYTTKDTFCAGYTNGSSVCHGDSGGGMILQRPTASGRLAYQLRGIVSLSAGNHAENKCESYNYIVFTDVAKYLDFIIKAMQE